MIQRANATVHAVRSGQGIASLDEVWWFFEHLVSFYSLDGLDGGQIYGYGAIVICWEACT
jgi:hypothetical protein